MTREDYDFDSNHINDRNNSTISTARRAERVTLNIRGVIYQINTKAIEQQPGTLLADILRNHRGNTIFDDEIFFDRDPFIFNCIMNFYSSGHLHFRHCMCRNEVQNELEYWKIDSTKLAPCCWVWFGQKAATEKKCRAVSQNFTEDKTEQLLPPNGWRIKLYRIMENPNSSRLAYMWSIFILSIIGVSIFGFILESLSSCRVPRKRPIFNETDFRTQHTNTLLINANTSNPHLALTLIDVITNVILTIELVLRFMVTPQKGRFCLNILIVIDILATIPTWLCLILFSNFDHEGHVGWSLLDDYPNAFFAFIVLRSSRLLRVFRLFRLVRTQNTIRIVLLSWKKSYKELLLLCGLLTIISTIYGSLIFFIESSEERFDTIPMGMWWSIITMTTVGYGDEFPVTTGGYIVGILCAVTGLVVVATPIPVIVNNFSSLSEALGINMELAGRDKQIKLKESQDGVSKPAMSVEM
ncbi:hypothetical protein CAPTEDRAFT_187221 [Capitella teleta]|uniref:BTB domain-containing protein n=1 Tax=Capitella teleta TaxID=283909 RepID=R7V9J3_CAPTE|nr:hypothetical protein CAPTEDRAFT_187221 [Capitella teleta]|eukprot:ELU15234.1 hypothetical protein CAPTEDRAFT_187221 [Capitella teleta]